MTNTFPHQLSSLPMMSESRKRRIVERLGNQLPKISDVFKSTHESRDHLIATLRDDCSYWENRAKEAENRAETAEKKAKQGETQNIIVSAFIHDLRNKLSVLLNNNDLITLGLEPEEQAAIIAENNQTVKKITDQIVETLSASKLISSSNEKLPIVDFQLDDLIGKIIIRYPDLPIQISNPQGIDYIQSNPEHLQRIFENIIDNAIKYAGKTPDISIHFQERDHKLHILIYNSGKAIEGDINEIFEFHKQNGSSKNGFGVGLAYCKLICENLGGSIRAENLPNNYGCVFKICLPQQM